MPVGDVIEMVAGLLTKITTTNDHDRSGERHHAAASGVGGGMGGGGVDGAVLAFHGKNVPGITIQSYLARIHKYCPTTYEVFLSLLVYFDRMTERVNKPSRYMSGSGSVTSGDDVEGGRRGSEGGGGSRKGSVAGDGSVGHGEGGRRHQFVVDSFNIHRLVIAGVTCASKFFSDVFYTNSRYAKVSFNPLSSPSGRGPPLQSPVFRFANARHAGRRLTPTRTQPPGAPVLDTE